MDEALQAAIEDLVADYERLGVALDMVRVERLVRARKFSFTQTAELLDALIERNIPVLIVEKDTLEEVALEEEAKDLVYDGERWYRQQLDHPLLDAATEHELGRTIAIGIQAEAERDAGHISDRIEDAISRGAAARERMAVCNFRLVWQLARRYALMTGLDELDLFQDGNIGLLRAIEKYDPDQGTRFSTYATWWIRQSISRAAIDRGRTIRLPSYIHADTMKLARAARLLWREKGRRPSLRDLANELAWDLDRIAFLQGVSALVPIAFEDLAKDEYGLSLHELVPDSAPGPDAALEASEEAAMIDRALSELPANLRAIVTLRNGLGGRSPETLEAIGKYFGVTRERIRQLENKAMGRLRIILPRMFGTSTISQRLLPSTKTEENGNKRGSNAPGS